eukprot:TRINITY_DN5850_c0_g2_i1.p1 TRINITY_DN5850_c0_g2~~TRINITY_DN5850_c0_g2_i1.p1  ORF type:complete len:504 (+),score=24.17 TRINITY_DN5850_c0_g2_i1:207-1514(+)
MFELPPDVVIQFTGATAITFLRSRILGIVHIRSSCRTLEALWKFPVQKLIADVCVQCHGTVPCVLTCSHSVICRVGASAKMAVLLLLEALEYADVRKSAFGHIPKDRVAAVDEGVLARCAQLLSHSDSETRRYASLLMQCWKGEATCRKLGVMLSTRGKSSSATYQLNRVHDSDPDLKAIARLEDALDSDRILDSRDLSSVVELVRQDSSTSSQELAGILSGLGLDGFPRSIMISNAGSNALNGTYKIMHVPQPTSCSRQRSFAVRLRGQPTQESFGGQRWYKQQNGPHRLFFSNAIGDDPDGWYIDSEKNPLYAFYASACGQDEVPTRGWTVYAGSFTAEGKPPAPSLTYKDPAEDEEFQRSACRLCKLARCLIQKRNNGTRRRSQSRSRSRGRFRNQQDDRVKGKSASKGVGGLHGGHGGKSFKGNRRRTGWR